MGKTEAVVFLVAVCVSVSFCQDQLAKRILEERSFQDALSKVEYLLDHLDDIKIKDVKGKSGDISYELTNIRITDFDTPVPSFEFVDGFRNVNAKLTLSSLTADADWWARYKGSWLSITKSGSLTATASDMSVSVSLVDFRITDCDARVDLSVKLSGGGLPTTWIARLIEESAFIDDFEDDLADMENTGRRDSH